MNETIDYDGRVVLITGGGRGMGRSHADLLARHGARLIICDAGKEIFGTGGDASVAQQLVDELAATGTEARAYTRDLSDEDAARAAVRFAIAEFGCIDAIVHNAGLTLGSAPFETENVARFDTQMAINARAAYALVQEAWPHFQTQGGGRVVIVGSTAMYGLPQSTPYSVAKSAYLGLTRALAAEGHDQNIHVNLVLPSEATRMADNMPDSEFKRWFMATMKAGSVSPVIGWLAHHACPINGQTFITGGGRVARLCIAETIGHRNPENTIASAAQTLAETMNTSDWSEIHRFQDSMDMMMDFFDFRPSASGIKYAGAASTQGIATTAGNQSDLTE